MDYAEALKKVQTKKTKENYLVVELSYRNKIILPYKEGVALMSALNNAENLTESYSEPKIISGLDRDAIKASVMSADEYELIKIAALLKVTVEEAKEFGLQAA